MSEARERCHLRLVTTIEKLPPAEQHDPVHQSINRISDRDLARRLARIKLASIDAAIWRHMSPREHSRPDSGDGATGTGGRFNPPDSFPVVYGSLSRSAAGAEFRRVAQRNPIGIENLLPRHLYRFRIKSDSALDLRLPSVREALDLPEIRSAAIHRAHSQLIGEMARALGIHLIVAPSAIAEHSMAAIFPDLVPQHSWEFRHMEIWMNISDVPGTADVLPGSIDERMTMG